MTENHPQLRIGHDERNAAIKALDDHLSAGRLDPDEYGERMAAASMARTRDELERLFIDLPEPHPFARRSALAPPAWQPPATSGYPAPLRSKMSFAVAIAALIAVMPFIALALFIATKMWFVFLLVPAVGALLGGRGACGPRYRAGRGRYYR